MIVQWACKGFAKMDARVARNILANGEGIRCRGWLAFDPKPFPLGRHLKRLTEQNLDLHVNNYSYPDPATGVPFYQTTPFISLAAGCVERDTLLRANVTYSALRTAFEFATTDYSQHLRTRCSGWVIYCYVLVGVNRAVAIQSVAEEYRELNHARAYSQWYRQGEIAAKINIPSNQIPCAVHWKLDPITGDFHLDDILINTGFTHPAAVLDERNML